MDELKKFEEDKKSCVAAIGQSKELKELGLKFMLDTAANKYSYNFSWMGRPIIAFPQDMIAMQEIIWEVKPDLIIETGVAHGGSIVYYASLLQLIGGDGLVVGIDIDIRKHNRDLIEAHPMFKRMRLIEGSSISAGVIDQVKQIASTRKKVMVCLDSNHTHAHVLQELSLYAPLTSKGSYCVVFDTVVEDIPSDYEWNRPWGKGNNPKTAVWEFLKSHPEFEVDSSIHNKLLITVAPDGYLKRVK
ncbi:MAG TPA: cephalosporin hydroxylase family protein [Bacteroidia bacterium]